MLNIIVVYQTLTTFVNVIVSESTHPKTGDKYVVLDTEGKWWYVQFFKPNEIDHRFTIRCKVIVLL